MKATGYLLTAGAVAAGAVAAGAVAALVVVALIWSFSQRPSPVAATQSPSATPTASTPTPGAYRLNFALVKEGVAWFPQSATYVVQVPSATTSATYAVAAPPTSIPAGANAQIAVALTNTGNQTWNTAGANPVNLSLHWYDA